jgi:DNA repair protein SbcD/Mre11
VRRLLDWYTEGFALDTVNIVAAHCLVQGGVLGGGERDAQLIDEYAVPSAAFPASANYVALGHLHRTQQIPGAAPIWYSGSPIQVDFGEEADVKHALLVDIPERGGAKVTPVPLTRGWTLRTVRGTFEELEAIAGSTGDAWLRVVVSEPARPGLADDVRELLPQAVDVRITSPATQASDERAIPTRTHAAPRELFGSYLDWEQRARDERLLALFDDLLDADTQPAEVG